MYEVESIVTIGNLMYLHICFLDSTEQAGSINWMEVKEAFLEWNIQVKQHFQILCQLFHLHIAEDKAICHILRTFGIKMLV